MGYPRKVSYVSLTVPIAASESDALDLDAGVAIGLVAPAALEATTAQVSFKAATSLAGTYKVVKQNGTKLTVPIAVDDFGMLYNITDLIGVRFLKIVLETAGGVAVAQATAARVFSVVKMDSI